MSERLKILVSAYACEPGKGSEPEVGWQTAVHLAAHHEVTVVTRANNRERIEAGLAVRSSPCPDFIYYDLPGWLRALKRAGLPVAAYYFLWQTGVRMALRRRLGQFDVIHHATFNSFRSPGIWWWTGRPTVLGPLGGGQICPWRFLPWPRWQAFTESFRTASVMLSFIFPHLFLSFLAARRLLIVNDDTARRVPWFFRKKIVRMLETAVSTEQLVESRPERRPGPVRFLWMSRFDRLKGGDLALRAFAEARQRCPGIVLTFGGSGPEERELRKLIECLDLGDSVVWRGFIPRSDVLATMLAHDVFVFTSLRDTSGNALLEAMAAGMAPITFNHHGAREMTTESCALRVPVTGPRATIAALADAMVTLATDEERRAALGCAAQERVRAQFTWPAHAERLSGILREAAGLAFLLSTLIVALS